MRTLALTLAALLIAPRAGAQAIPVTIVELSPTVAAQVEPGFEPSREHLWCVTAWTTAVRRGGFTLVTVTGVREADDARTRATETEITPTTCQRPDGSYLPTLHSHPHGTCAAFPRDLEAYAQRSAEFDGVLCAPRSSVWVTKFAMRAMIRLAGDETPAVVVTK